jgi:CDP-2,3-bis-(O-geranylgeranyl)-sn-glycerol synthase
VIIEALWFFLPAGIANAVPVIAPKIPGLGDFTAPLDFGKTYRGKRIFGANKTWRGLLVGMAAATLIIALQKYLFTRNLFILELAWFDYRPVNIWLLGPLFGAGALLADAVESFFKRQRGIKPGYSWFPFDQIDYIIGGCVFSLAIEQLAWTKYTLVLLVWFFIHLIASYVAYTVGLKDKPI